MGTDKTQQQQLFASPHTAYVWKSVQHVKRGEHVVIMQEEVRISTIREQGGEYLLTFSHPTDGKSEQLYSDHDFLYARKE